MLAILNVRGLHSWMVVRVAARELGVICGSLLYVRPLKFRPESKSSLLYFSAGKDPREFSQIRGLANIRSRYRPS